jgi:hypothetical protein
MSAAPGKTRAGLYAILLAPSRNSAQLRGAASIPGRARVTDNLPAPEIFPEALTGSVNYSKRGTVPAYLLMRLPPFRHRLLTLPETLS